MTPNSILICGTGIVGLATTLAFSRQGFKPQLLGPRKTFHDTDSQQYYPRVYALSPASQQFLHELGVWGLLNHGRVTSVRAMDIYGDARGYVGLDAWQVAKTDLAWIIESSELERVLQQLVIAAGVTWHDDKFQSLSDGSVISEAGQRFIPKLLVGADGAQSPVRAAAAITTNRVPYGQSGVVTHLNAEHAHDNIARQWFSPQGIVALLPMPTTSDGPQVSLVWSMPTDKAKALLELADDSRNQRLQAELSDITGGSLGQLSVRSPVYSFPLTLQHSQMVAPGVALVGDAAHRIHPLAGQGLNLGLADAKTLAATVATRASRSHPGSIQTLRRYRRQRAEAIFLMGFACDSLYHLFAPQVAPAVALRNIGMNVVNRLPFVKRLLIEGAS